MAFETNEPLIHHLETNDAQVVSKLDRKSLKLSKDRKQELIDEMKKLPEDLALTPVNGNKAPYRNGWASEKPLSRKFIEAEILQDRALGIGLRTGITSKGLLCIDFDGYSTMPKLMELSGGKELPPTVTYTSGRPGRKQMLFRVPKEYWDMIATRKIAAGLDDEGNTELLELRWNGLQSVLPPSYHPMTGRYFYLEGCSFEEIEIAEAPDWLIELVMRDKHPPEPQPEPPLEVPEGEFEDGSPIPKFTKEELRHKHVNLSKGQRSDQEYAISYLNALHPSRADCYDFWVKVGMILFFCLGKEGLRFWVNWSRQSQKFQEGACEKKWGTFGKYVGRKVTLGTLGYWAKQDGWVSPFKRDKIVSLPQKKIVTVTSPGDNRGDNPNPVPVSLSEIVTIVAGILDKQLAPWEEQFELDQLEEKSGLSRAAFKQLLQSCRCRYEEFSKKERERLDQLLDWREAKLDFNKVLPGLGADVIHDAAVLNVDPVMIWQFLMPVVLSLLSKETVLDVVSHTVPPIANTAIVAESGTGKTRAENLVVSPLRDMQIKELERYEKEEKQYQIDSGDTEGWKKKQRKSEKPKKKDSQPIEGDGSVQPPEEPINEEPPKPEPPQPARRFLFDIATFESVMRRQSEKQTHGAIWCRDELPGLVKGLDQYKPSGQSEGAECLLSMWDGKPTFLDRVQKSNNYFLEKPRLSIAGNIQPGIFSKVFKDPNDSNGLAARFLFAVAQLQPAKRITKACVLAEKLPLLYKWISEEFPEGKIRLSESAERLYDKLYNQIGEQAEQGETPAIRLWMRKLSLQLLRIAFALHVLDCYKEFGRPRQEIQIDTLRRAVEFARYYRASFRHLQALTTENGGTENLLLRILDEAQRTPKGYPLRDAYRIKAIANRAKELGREAKAFALDLFHELAAQGRGIVKKIGRQVLFCLELKPDDTEPETVVTTPEPQPEQDLRLSPPMSPPPVTVPTDEFDPWTEPQPVPALPGFSEELEIDSENPMTIVTISENKSGQGFGLSPESVTEAETVTISTKLNKGECESSEGWANQAEAVVTTEDCPSSLPGQGFWSSQPEGEWDVEDFGGQSAPQVPAGIGFKPEQYVSASAGVESEARLEGEVVILPSVAQKVAPQPQNESVNECKKADGTSIYIGAQVQPTDPFNWAAPYHGTVVGIRGERVRVQWLERAGQATEFGDCDIEDLRLLE